MCFCVCSCCLFVFVLILFSLFPVDRAWDASSLSGPFNFSSFCSFRGRNNLQSYPILSQNWQTFANNDCRTTGVGCVSTSVTLPLDVVWVSKTRCVGQLTTPDEDLAAEATRARRSCGNMAGRMEPTDTGWW